MSSQSPASPDGNNPQVMNGHFTFPGGSILAGSLSLAGPESKLTVWGATASLDTSRTHVECPRFGGHFRAMFGVPPGL